MKIRELLQTEIWSKRTSRKILVGSGIVFGLFLVCFAVWYEAEIHWLTSGERDAARVALKEIDALQDADSLNDQEFRDRSELAEAKVKLAEEAAATYRDNFIQMKLGLYLVSVETERWKIERQKLVLQGRISQGEQHGQQDEAIESLLRDLKRRHQLELHEVLDQQ
jgi:hypothetical protein